MTGGREDRVGVLAHPVRGSEDEGGRLASARLGGGEEVATLEDQRDGIRLDRRWCVVPLFGNGLEEIGRQAERIKWQHDSCSFRPRARPSATAARWRTARSIADMATIEA